MLRREGGSSRIGIIREVFGGDHRLHPFPQISLSKSSLLRQFLGINRLTVGHGLENAETIANVNQRRVHRCSQIANYFECKLKCLVEIRSNRTCARRCGHWEAS